MNGPDKIPIRVRRALAAASGSVSDQVRAGDHPASGPGVLGLQRTIPFAHAALPLAATAARP